MSKLKQYKKQIVFAGFVVGALGFFNVLPETLPVLNNMTNIFYAGVVGLGLYTFNTFYANQPIPKRVPVPGRNFPRKKPAENSHPRIDKSLRTEADTTEGEAQSSKIFGEFHKD